MNYENETFMVCSIIYCVISSFFLIGYYVKDCVRQDGPEDYCYRMLIATSFFSAIDLLIILIFICAGFITCLEHYCCEQDEEGIVRCVRFIECCCNNLNVLCKNRYRCLRKKENKELKINEP